MWVSSEINSPCLYAEIADLPIVLHKLKLVHTDLKPENILLVENGSRLQGPRVCVSLHTDKAS